MGKKWYDSLCRSLPDIAFKKSEANPAIFYMHVRNDIVVLMIHVDDSTMTSSSVNLQKEYKAHINAKFQLTDLGPILWLLGLAITCDRATCTLSLSQHAYIDTLLCHFNLKDCKPLAQPLDPHIQFSVDQCLTNIEEKAAMKLYCTEKLLQLWIGSPLECGPILCLQLANLCGSWKIPGVFTGKQWNESSDTWRVHRTRS